MILPLINITIISVYFIVPSKSENNSVRKFQTNEEKTIPLVRISLSFWSSKNTPIRS